MQTIDKIFGSDITGKKKMGALMGAQRTEQAKVRSRQQKEEEAIRGDEARRAASQKKVRGGAAGRRSLLTSDFKGVQGKKATLG